MIPPPHLSKKRLAELPIIFQATAAPSNEVACLDLPFSMLRSCSRSVRRCAAVAMKHQTRAISCAARTPAPAAAAVAGRGSLHASPGRGFSRRGLSTLTDEQLRRKMDEFNDLFVTVSLSEQWYSLSVRKISCPLDRDPLSQFTPCQPVSARPLL